MTILDADISLAVVDYLRTKSPTPFMRLLRRIKVMPADERSAWEKKINEARAKVEDQVEEVRELARERARRQAEHWERVMKG